MSCHHRGPYVQRGRGFGGTLGAMYKGVVPAYKVMGQQQYTTDEPLTKSVLETTGLDMAADPLNGNYVRDSLKRHLATAKREVSSDSEDDTTVEDTPPRKRVKTRQQEAFDDPVPAMTMKTTKTIRRRAKPTKVSSTDVDLPQQVSPRRRQQQQQQQQQRQREREWDLFDTQF